MTNLITTSTAPITASRRTTRDRGVVRPDVSHGLATPRSNRTRTPARGTTKAYTLIRLARDHPALYARVVAGELSAHQAAIQAGFRRKRTPVDVAMRALLQLNDVQWRIIATWRDGVRIG